MRKLKSRCAPSLQIICQSFWETEFNCNKYLLNLILNAVEAVSAANESSREVLISSSRDQSDGVEIAIHDTGIGLEHSDIDHLFDAFHTTKPGGMGIGLTISRSIIEAHGGSIRATATGPRGAVFDFTLPGGRDAEV